MNNSYSKRKLVYHKGVEYQLCVCKSTFNVFFFLIMLTFVTCDCCFHLSFARQHSLMWNISQGCTTGTPAPMHGPPFAMFVRIVCLGSHLTASPVKVSTNTLKATHAYYHTCETQKGSLFHVFHFKFGVRQHVFVITGWKIKRFLALASRIHRLLNTPFAVR